MLVPYSPDLHAGLPVLEVRFSEPENSTDPGGFGMVIEPATNISEGDPYCLYMVVEDEALAD